MGIVRTGSALTIGVVAVHTSGAGEGRDRGVAVGIVRTGAAQMIAFVAKRSPGVDEWHDRGVAKAIAGSAPATGRKRSSAK